MSGMPSKPTRRRPLRFKAAPTKPRVRQYPTGRWSRSAWSTFSIFWRTSTNPEDRPANGFSENEYYKSFAVIVLKINIDLEQCYFNLGLFILDEEQNGTACWAPSRSWLKRFNDRLSIMQYAKEQKITLPLRDDFGICRDPKIVQNTTSDTVYFKLKKVPDSHCRSVLWTLSSARQSYQIYAFTFILC